MLTDICSSLVPGVDGETTINYCRARLPAQHVEQLAGLQHMRVRAGQQFRVTSATKCMFNPDRALRGLLCLQVEQLAGLQHMRVRAGQQYHTPGEAYVEGDASSASYFLAGAALTGNMDQCHGTQTVAQGAGRISVTEGALCFEGAFDFAESYLPVSGRLQPADIVWLFAG